MTSLKTSPLDAVMKRISDAVPTAPAAGSAAALTGAAAAALGCFVSHLSARHAGNLRTSNLLQRVGDRFSGLRETCLDLMDADVEAYAALVQIIHKAGPAQADGELPEVTTARKGLLYPPMKLAASTIAMFRLYRLLICHAYPPALTDAAVAVETARGCLESALMIAEENTAAVKDPDTCATYRKTIEKYRNRGERLYHSCRIACQKKF